MITWNDYSERRLAPPVGPTAAEADMQTIQMPPIQVPLETDRGASAPYVSNRTSVVATSVLVPPVRIPRRGHAAIASRIF